MNQKIKRALDKIKEGIESGESIQMARRSVCTPNSVFGEMVMRTQEYCDLLNAYLEMKGRKVRYELHKGKLRSINGPKSKA